MARMYKCYGWCNEKHEKEHLEKVGTTNFCKPCADRKRKETEDRTKLYQTIKTIYEIPYPTGQMLGQIKQYTEERGYTLEGITKTLCYYVKVLQKKPQAKFGLALVPYNYIDAVKYYDSLEEKRKNNNSINNSVVTIKIKPKMYGANENVIKKRIISMEDCLDDR